jgi:hypothetical protein
MLSFGFRQRLQYKYPPTSFQELYKKYNGEPNFASLGISARRNDQVLAWRAWPSQLMEFL